MSEAIEQLKNHQKQLDADGVMVGVSRQALDEVLDRIAELESKLDECKQVSTAHCLQADKWRVENQRLRDALEQVARIAELEKVAEAAEHYLKHRREIGGLVTALRAAGYLKEQKT